MAFTPPTFNLPMRVWRVGGVGGNYAAPDLTVVINLSAGRRVLQAVAAPPLMLVLDQFIEFLCPKLTDVRGPWNGSVGDLVECPAGSKRFYVLFWVDDVGKGFANEYRLALGLYQPNGNTTLAGGPFAAPVPLP